MQRGGQRPSLAERHAATRRTAERAPAPSPGADCPARHCWVADAADRLGVKRPGLLVEWREASAGWQGRVVYVAELRPGEWATVEEWLPAGLLTPL
jgi:hypothetical protein